MALNYDYRKSKSYCEHLGLVWLGDAFVESADKEAREHGFTQPQMDAAMRQHLWQVRFLFNPRSYNWLQRLTLAMHFIFNFKRDW